MGRRLPISNCLQMAILQEKEILRPPGLCAGIFIGYTVSEAWGAMNYEAEAQIGQFPRHRTDVGCMSNRSGAAKGSGSGAK